MSAAVQSVAGLHTATARKPEHRNEIVCVQSLRGIAVLLVLVVHVEDMANHIPQFADLHSWYSRNIGYSAPDLFFVISGFIMSYITLGMPFRPKQWLTGRFVRIYPMYFLFSLLALLIYLWQPARPVMGWARMIYGPFWPHSWCCLQKACRCCSSAGLCSTRSFFMRSYSSSHRRCGRVRWCR